MNLRSSGILLILLLTTISYARSQDRAFIVGTMIGFYGIHIQGDISDVYSSTSGTFWGTGGLSFGLNVKRDISDKTYGAFELRYIRKGSLYEFITDYGIPAYESIKLDYIEFPFIIGLKINLPKKFLFLEAGLAYARLMNSKMLVSELNRWDPSSTVDNFKKDDLSCVANLKYPIIKNNKLLIGFRFTYSLMSIHTIYNLYNMDYGVELYYLFN